MPVLTPAQLPAEAVATLRLIAAGGPYPYAQDNTIFGNYGGVLRRERYGYYREFTVRTPWTGGRGRRRVIAGSGGEDYYTADHYTSFEWIACPR
jgi:ribonuclease T1